MAGLTGLFAAFSTSSPWASVAIVTSAGEVRWAESRFADHRAGGACLEMLRAALTALGIRLADLEAFAADVGPGSFTGVRVGVVLAKTFAFLGQTPVFGADSFDLVDPTGAVVLPSKKGEYFVRRPGLSPYRTGALPEAPYMGYGPGIEPSTPPDAARFAAILRRLPAKDAIHFAPDYLIEPSISTPKQPFPTTAKMGSTNG